MESALSEEEFHRLQLQLIELRTENYQLTDKCKKQDSEVLNLNQRLQTLDKDLQRATKAISKSKKAKELEQLIQENEGLQRRLHNQEEEFRLQNGTLMQELALLVSRNEELESSSKVSADQPNEQPTKPSESTEDGNSSELAKEVMRLKAENTALQTNIGTIKDKFDGELKLLRSAVDGVDITECDSSSNDGPDVSLTHMIQESQVLSMYNDVKLSLDTVKAENELLHQRLDEVTKSSSAEASELLREKLKKKQESYVALQAEKEMLYKETADKIQSLEEARQRDIKNYHHQIERLNEDVRNAKEETSSIQTQCDQRVNNLETSIQLLKSKIDENSMKKLEMAQQELERLRAELDVLNQKLTNEQSELLEVKGRLSDTEKLSANQTQRLEELQTQLDNTEQILAEKSQTAEKRKKLLDELAIKSQEDSDLYKSKLAQLNKSNTEQMDSLISAHKQEVVEITRQLDQQKNKASLADKLKSELEALNERCTSLEEAKGWLQRSLQESEAKVKENEAEHAAKMEELESQQEQCIADLTEEKEKTTLALEAQLSEKCQLLEGLQAEKEELKQKIADNRQDKRLHEKKGAGLMKDLKRQLAQERKRADRLEQRIQELSSSETKLRQQSSEPFFLPIDSERLSVRADDASSVSSWSGANFSHQANSSSGSVLREASIASIKESPPRTSPQAAEHDVSSLLILVESLQKEKSSLSERVSILEQGNSAMAEDLLKKQSIIEYYTMEGKEYVNTPKKSEKMTLKRVMDFVKDKGDESMNERYRKCQRMLEETLTKNMYLQTNLEELSKQLAEVKVNSETS